MGITRILAIVILCLVLYNGTMVKLIDSSKKRRTQKKENTPHTAPKDFDTKLQLGASLIFCILLMYLLLTNMELLTLLLFLPIAIIYVAVFISASSTVGALAMSKGENPLTQDENGSLILVGIFAALIGFLRSSNSKIAFCQEVTIIECLLIAAEHSVYIFLIGALLIRPMKDCAGATIIFAYKVKSKYIAVSNHIINKVRPRKRKYVFSVLLLSKREEKPQWLRRVISGCLVLAIPFDIIGYLIQYTATLFIWLPMSLVVMIIMMFGKYLLRIMRWIHELSGRRVAVISFRISIMTAMLIVVIANRYGYIKTTEATTSILEFIASVAIIPIIFEWIHVSISSGKEQ